MVKSNTWLLSTSLTSTRAVLGKCGVRSGGRLGQNLILVVSRGMEWASELELALKEGQVGEATARELVFLFVFVFGQKRHLVFT